MRSTSSFIPALNGFQGRALEVDTLAVDPCFQGQGLGHFLLIHAALKAKELDCSSLLATVDPRNIGSMQLFQSFGFKIIDKVNAYSYASPDWIIDTIDAGALSIRQAAEESIERNILEFKISS